jgi:hypothetical protein
MEALLKHIKKHAPYYILGFLSTLVVAFVSYNVLNRRVENFQEPSGPAVASGAPVRLSKETCIPLKSQIDQYLQVKQQYKDTRILNLDDTLKDLEKYFREYGCDLHTD